MVDLKSAAGGRSDSLLDWLEWLAPGGQSFWLEYRAMPMRGRCLRFL
jgi:hypothetical protein